MQKILLFGLMAIVMSCGPAKIDSAFNETIMDSYADEIKSEDLKEHLYLLSSDILEGRKTGGKRQKMAVNYFTAYYEHLGLSAPEEYPDYTQLIPKAYFENKSEDDSKNVVAFVPGSEFPGEVIVISAHYDHLGMDGEEVYNGADDNASGSSALMELAQSFQLAKKKGYGPKRSILFLHVTGEEIGLYGSKYYVEHPVYSLDSTVADLNIDMIGRVDEKHMDQRNYIYLIGAKRHSKDLFNLSERVNKEQTQLKLDFSYDDPKDPQDYFKRSDHYNFAKNNIPVIFFFNGTHEDYHRTTDTADKIDYDLLALRTKFIFYIAWELANSKDRLVPDPK